MATKVAASARGFFLLGGICMFHLKLFIFQSKRVDLLCSGAQFGGKSVAVTLESKEKQAVL